MKSFRIFIIRLVLALLLAVLIGRFFFPHMSVISFLGLAGIMLVLAYLFQYTRKRDKGEKNGV